MSPVKEPSFFCDIFQVVSNPVDYISLYNRVKDEKAIGEASHVYMSFPKSARTLNGFFPKAKFILILRNPAERAYSLYKHMVYHGVEWARTFEKALAMEGKRRRSPAFKRKCPHYYYNYLYFASGLYGEQLKRYFHEFEKERFLIFTFEQFQQDPLEVLARIYDHLEVDGYFKPKLKTYNQKQFDIKRPMIHYLLTYKLKSHLTRLKAPYPAKIEQFSYRINRKEKQGLRQSTKRELMRRFTPDLNELGKLTGLSFDNWFDPL